MEENEAKEVVSLLIREMLDSVLEEVVLAQKLHFAFAPLHILPRGEDANLFYPPLTPPATAEEEEEDEEDNIDGENAGQRKRKLQHNHHHHDHDHNHAGNNRSSNSGHPGRVTRNSIKTRAAASTSSSYSSSSASSSASASSSSALVNTISRRILKGLEEEEISSLSLPIIYHDRELNLVQLKVLHQRNNDAVSFLLQLINCN